jgi:hypothetical protein
MSVGLALREATAHAPSPADSPLCQAGRVTRPAEHR